MVGYSQNKVVLDRALDGTQVRGIRSAFRARRAQRQALRSRRLAVTTSASASSSGGLAEEDGTQQGGGLDDQNLTVPTTCMAKLSGSGGATMQKSKLNLTQEVRISQPKTDDAGGGGDIGNRIFNGGGGDGDDSDDDEYQDDFGDDDEEDAKVGLFDVRDALPELFDKATMECILSEWYKTVVSLPAGLRMAVEMSVISSAQLVRFLSMDYRPKLTRAVTRALPTEPARHFVGRMMGDPAFLYKMGLEQFLTITGSVLCELKIRGGERFRKEWKEVVARTTALCVGNAALVWMTAPSRAFGSTSKFGWQQHLSKLPNHVFERSSPLRRYTMVDRSQAFLYKAGQLGLVGLTSGALGVALTKLVGGGQEEDPKSATSAHGWRGPIMGLGLQMAISSHLRYQGIAGVDRWLGQRCSHLGMVLGGTTALRVTNAAVGEVSRTLIQGQNLFTFGKGGEGKKKRRRRRPASSRRKSAMSGATSATIKARAAV
mmetsp:Transcript_4342/g.15561  ORF Transcript_4342/g.15561 Transcript_4342/m.15561 type:complete len:487 (+) Transcript_4342:436-1896(+)